MTRFTRTCLHLSLSLFAALGATACGDDEPTSDAGVDAGNDAGRPDSGTPDSGTPDTGVDAGTPDTGTDAGTPDSGVPDDFRIPGLTGAVTVSVDGDGVTHIGCRTDEDCLAVEGYMHAAHRFGQMDLRRRFVRGRLAEIFGALGADILDIDKQSRSFIATRDGGRLEEQLWAATSTPTQAAVTAYTRGVNAWIDDLRNGRNGARLTDEWQIGAGNVTDWEELDSVACILALMESLTNDSAAELDRGALAAELEGDVFSDLFGLLPASESTILPPVVTARTSLPDPVAAIRNNQARWVRAKSIIAEAMANMPPARDMMEGTGSNNWIVSASQTSNGKALLANDPHLGLENPAIWYLVSVDSKTNGTGTLHFAGSSFTGLPGIIIGRNENIAWGMTTTFFDQADVYLETVTASGTAVRFNGQDVPFVSRDFTFGVAGQSPVTETFLYVPHHGPVVAFDGTDAVSVRWAGHDMDTDLDFLLPMLRATNIAEAKAALGNLTSSGQNVVVVDRQGQIGWFPYSRVPNRPWASAIPPWMPVPGTGEAEWEGDPWWIPYENLPQAENPSEGFLATANNDMLGALLDGDPTNDGLYLQNFVAAGYRHQRIMQRLRASAGAHNRGTMQSIQADVYSLVGDETLVPILEYANAGVSGLDANGQAVLAVLTAWDYECPTGLDGILPTSPADTTSGVAASAAGCMAMHALIPRLHKAVFDDEVEAAGLVGRRARLDPLVTLLVRPNKLAAGPVYWDDVNTSEVETSTTMVVRALNEAGAYLDQQFGADTADWLWGKKHTITFAFLLPVGVDNGPFTNDGGLFTVDVANPSGAFSDSYSHGAGPSMRLACEADSTSGIDCTIEFPGGERMFSDSPYYDNLARKWLLNEPIPLLFEATDIAQATVETLEFQAP